MSHEPMDVDELAAYLKRDARDVHKLASKGLIPGKKSLVNGVFKPMKSTFGSRASLSIITKNP